MLNQKFSSTFRFLINFFPLVHTSEEIVSLPRYQIVVRGILTRTMLQSACCMCVFLGHSESHGGGIFSLSLVNIAIYSNGGRSPVAIVFSTRLLYTTHAKQVTLCARNSHKILSRYYVFSYSTWTVSDIRYKYK